MNTNVVPQILASPLYLLHIELVYYQATSGKIFFNGAATKNLLLLKTVKIDIVRGFYLKLSKEIIFFM